MKDSSEIKLKEEKDPTVWERFVQWLHGNANQLDRSVQQVPKTGTNTEILLSKTQKILLAEAVEPPGEKASDTSFRRKSEAGPNSSELII